MVNERFGSTYSCEQIKSYCNSNKLANGFDGRFSTGHTRTAERPVGYERANCQGYIEVKTAEPPRRTSSRGNYAYKHQLVWEQANGPVPEGHRIIFLDGDKTNCALDNLAVVTRAENGVMVTRRLRYKRSELTRSGVLVARVIVTAKEKQKTVGDSRQNPAKEEPV